jgi:hypothetical protein
MEPGQTQSASECALSPGKSDCGWTRGIPTLGSDVKSGASRQNPTVAPRRDQPMRLVRSLGLTLFNILLLYVLLVLLSRPDASYYGAQPDYRFGKGNASDTVRAQVLQQLARFQDGYSKRDTSLLASYTSELLSSDNVLVLGTMPREVRTTSADAARLIEEDWLGWGDCRFLVENTHVSAAGGTAWFATVGTVKMDIGLVLPLRLSGVMVNEQGVWKVQHLQFQFDLDLNWLLLVEALLLIWLAVNVGVLTARLFRMVRARAT